MMNKKYIPYNSSNKEYATANRKHMTKYEGLVRHTILKGKRTGYKRIRQKMIGSYILDFYCSELLLCVEIDGKYHEQTGEYDRIRERYLRKKGIKTVRYANEEVDKKLHAVSRGIMKEIEEREIVLAG